MIILYKYKKTLDKAPYNCYTNKCSKAMREWLSGRASPCQGERREFESRLPLTQGTHTSVCVLFFFKGEAYEKNIKSDETGNPEI